MLSLVITLQIHPDARSFRNKFLQNYDQLCIIFGNHNEAAEAINASPIQCGGKAKDQGKSMRWTNEMDRCLGRVLVEQIVLGNKNKLDNKFKLTA